MPLTRTLAAALLLAGCSAPESGDNLAVPAEENVAAAIAEAPAAPTPLPSPEPLPTATASPSPSASPTTGATQGGDGSEIRLSPLTAADIDGAALDGELACSFAGMDKATLLLAKGDVASKERAFGLVKVGDYLERVSAPGGFDAMLKGGTFAGKGLTLRIALTGRATGGGESPPRPATATVDRADGAKRVIPGTWTCGP